MGNFVVDGTVLPGPKAEWDGVSTQAAHPEMFLTPVEFNVYRDAINDLRALGPVYDARAYLALDGVTPDDVALNALMQSVKPTPGQAAPVGVTIRFPPFAKVLCAHTLVVPNWVALEGDTSGSTMIFPTPTFNSTCLIRNDLQTGTGEFVRLRNLYLWGAKGTGAICSDAVVQILGGFINSDLTDCIIQDGSNHGLHIGAKGTPGGAGPLVIDNTWVANCNGHGVLVDEDGTNTGAVNGIYFHHVTVENQGSNHSAVFLSGNGHCTGIRFDNLHVEMGGVGAGARALTINNYARVVVDSCQILGNPATLDALGAIVITNTAANVGIQLRAVTNENALKPILTNQKDSTVIGASVATNLDWYVSSDVAIMGGVRFKGSATGTGFKALAVQDAGGTDRFYFDGNGTGSGLSAIGSAGLDLASKPGASIDRPLALLNATARDGGSGSIFTYEFPTGGGGAVQLKCNGNAAEQIGTDGSKFLYQLQTLGVGVLGQGTRTAAPAFPGVAGQIVFNANPVAAGFIGWVCITPSTWKTWGVISP